MQDSQNTSQNTSQSPLETATFTDEEVDLAHQLKSAGLVWGPSVGHFVWDREHLIAHDSPFGGRIYFILELKHFLRRSESLQHLTESMVWLPTWPQVRVELALRNVPAQHVAQRLVQTRAIELGRERTELYQMLLEQLRDGTASGPRPPSENEAEK